MEKIGLIVPREEMLYQAHEILQMKKYNIAEIRVIDSDDTIISAREMISNGISIIIARGLQANLLKQYTNVTVVDIVLTAQEMGLMIVKSKMIVNKDRPTIAVVGFENMFCDMSYFEEIYNINLRTYFVKNNSLLKEVSEEAIRAGADIIIGGEQTIKIAEKFNVFSLFLTSTKDSLNVAFQAAENLLTFISTNKRSEAKVETITNNSFGGVANIDSKGIITSLNPFMESILNKAKDQVIGKHLSEIFSDIDIDEIRHILKDDNTYSTTTYVNSMPIYAILAPVIVEHHIEGAVLTCHSVIKSVNSNKNSEIDKTSILINFSDILQKSESMKLCVHKARLFSQSEFPVLMYGNEGGDYLMLAQCIHKNSDHYDGNFIEYECIGQDSLTQVKNIFDEGGIIDAANGGTLFLRNVDRLEMESQFRLFNLIKYHVVIGQDGVKRRYSNVRIIANTYANMESLIDKNMFRKDLYYLISGHKLIIPSIENRPEDLKYILESQIKIACERYSRFHKVTKGAWDKLLSYQWKGDIIQIESFIDYLILIANKRSIDEIMVSNAYKELYRENDNNEKVIIYNEKEKIIELLGKNNGSRQKTSEELGISKTTLWRKMKEYGIVLK